MDPKLKEKIEHLINADKVVLFMKGSPTQPKCGFSLQVANILRKHGIKFAYVDILEDEELRTGVKEYANWPTYPQLWAGGKLVGGCDIITQLDQSDELENALK